MTRKQILALYDAAITILGVLKVELDSREVGYGTIELAMDDLGKLHDWYLSLEDWE
jgi:hypothetical protein